MNGVDSMYTDLSLFSADYAEEVEGNTLKFTRLSERKKQFNNVLKHQ